MKTMVTLVGRLLRAAVKLRDDGVPAHVIIRAFRRCVVLCDGLRPKLCVPLLQAAGIHADSTSHATTALSLLFRDGNTDGQSEAVRLGIQCALGAMREILGRGLVCDQNAVQVFYGRATRLTGPTVLSACYNVNAMDFSLAPSRTACH